MIVNINYYCNTFKKNLFIIFREEKGGRGRGEEKYQCVVASHAPPTGTWPATQASPLHGNRTGDPLVCRPMLNPLSTPARAVNMLLIDMMHLVLSDRIIVTLQLLYRWEEQKSILVAREVLFNGNCTFYFFEEFLGNLRLVFDL